jgi:hypothetical protein
LSWIFIASIKVFFQQLAFVWCLAHYKMDFLMG